MKHSLLLMVVMFISIQTTNAQKTLKYDFVKTIYISRECKLGFKKYSAKMDLYYKPRIIKNGVIHIIQGFDEDNGSYPAVEVSPNKKFVIIPYIIKGYVYDGKTKFLHENPLCVIVDLKEFVVVNQMQSNCLGEWNKKNEWISGDEVIFIAK